ncbi:cell wall-binding repeat-containing protein, partial [Peribacillus tepidiphilus]|uniref:cell wall-binding repeat-containing protein n=1 Tax=Peribacillus tepidiphilus TaxID=2652445 RepID=UPI0035B54536
MRRKHVFVLLLSIVLFFGSFVSPFAASAASTISVKLQNYIGNKQSLDISTKGIYKFSNNNTRYSGSNRYEVADRVAAAGWQSASTVIVVNSEAFADALSAAPLAYKYNAPILMTSSTTLPAVMENRIKALRPSNIIIIGGSGSVSTEVEAKLKTLAPNVTRIGGKSRFEVAKLVSENFPTAQKAIVTNGLTFADALAIAPYAAKNGIPILLTTPSSLPESTTQALVGKTSTLIIGGESSVSKNVENQLAAPVRIGGKDRYEVSANIIKELNMNAETAFLSNGASFADALSGSVLAAKLDAPLLLTPSTKLPASVSAVISSKGTSNFHILGGTASVSDTLVNSLPNEYTLEPGVSYSVKAVNNSLVLYQGNTVVKSFDSNNFRLVPANYSSSNQILINNKPYLGTMDFTIENGYVRPINRDIPFEDYLKGVVPREMPASWEIEALKAQAVAARTYSVDDIGKTVVDTQSYQVYGGYQWDDRTNQAVNATKGKVLKFKNSKGNLELVQTFFSSSNGGYTAT